MDSASSSDCEDDRSLEDKDDVSFEDDTSREDDVSLREGVVVREDVPVLGDRNILSGLSFRVSWPFKNWRREELEGLIHRYGGSVYASFKAKVDYIITIRQDPYANEITPRWLLRLIQGKVSGVAHGGNSIYASAVCIKHADDDMDGPDLRLFSAEMRLLLQDCLRQKALGPGARDLLDQSSTERELQQVLHRWLEPTTFNMDDDLFEWGIPSWLVSELGPLDSTTMPCLDDMQEGVRRKIDLLSNACAAVGFDVILAVMERSLELLEVHDVEPGTPIYEEGVESLRLRHLTSSTGAQIAADLAMTPQQLISTDLFLEEPPDAVKTLKQTATKLTGRTRLKKGETPPRSAASPRRDKYSIKEWRRLVAVIVRPGELRELRQQTLAKCSSEQLLDRICDCAARVKSGVDDQQLKEEFLAVSTRLSVRAIKTDKILRSVRPDVSLQALLGYLVDAGLLGEDDEMLATVISHNSMAGSDVVRAIDWQANRKDFRGMKKWLRLAGQTHAGDHYDTPIKRPIKGSAAARLSHLSEVFSILHREYEHKDARGWLRKEIEKLPSSVSFQSSDAPGLLELCFSVGGEWFRRHSVNLFDHWPEGDPFPCIFFMATLDAHEDGQLSQEEMRKVFGEFISFFDDKMFFEEESSDEGGHPDDTVYNSNWYADTPDREIRPEERTVVSDHSDRPWPLSSRRRFFATSREMAKIIIQSLILNCKEHVQFLMRRLSYVPEVQEVSARRELLRELIAAVKGSESLLRVPQLDGFVGPVIEEWRTYTENPPWLEDDLVWPMRGCKSCVDCNTLDDFLQNGNEEALTFHVSPKRASHVESRVAQILAEDPLGLRLARESFDSRRCLLTVTKMDARWAEERTERERSRTDFKAAFRSLDPATAKALLGEEGYEGLSYETGSELEDIFDDSDEEEDEKPEDVTQLERMTFAQVSTLKRPLSPVHVNASVKRRMLQFKSNAVSLAEQENQPPVSTQL